METSYKNISYFFIGVLLCALIGFHQTYTMKFPTFQGLNWAHHFHGAMLMSWFMMLIVQPMLIRYKKYEWHRQLGKISYLLIPLLLYSIFLVTKVGFHRNITQMPRAVAVGGLALDIPDILAFSAYYILAMINREIPASHMRYMIGTSVLMIGPGVGRALIIYGGLPFPVAVNYTLYFADLVAVLFIIYDYYKGKSIKPFAVILGFLLVNHICWAFQMTGWWQAFGEWFAKSFF